MGPDPVTGQGIPGLQGYLGYLGYLFYMGYMGYMGYIGYMGSELRKPASGAWGAFWVLGKTSNYQMLIS